MIVLIDSDILIEVLRGRDPIISHQWLSLLRSGDDASYSPVSAAEVWTGARPSEASQTLTTLSALKCIDIDCNVGRIAGLLLSQFSKSHGLKIADALIAASAIHHGAALWTRNRKHYPMPQLKFY